MKFRLGAIALLAATALALAPGVAGAEMGLVGHFNIPFTGSGSLGSVGVNHAGTGGAAAGDVYFTGTELGTQRYSALGQFEGSFPGFGDIAVDQATGNVFYAGKVVSATGQLVLSHGLDAVRSGPDDSSVDAQQKLTVIASGGTFKLSCCFVNGTSISTKPLAYNAPAGEVQAAVDEMVAVKEPNSSVTVTGGPGGPTGPNPYTITFDGGDVAGDEVHQLEVDASKLTGSTTELTIATLVRGGAAEICTPPADVCRKSFDGTDVDSIDGSVGGAMFLPEGVALAPPSAPNAGNLLVAEHFSRVSEFTPSGSFIRAFGWDVDAQGPDDSSADEQQKLTIDATAGKFSLSSPLRAGAFDAGPAPTTGAVGHGDLASGSMTVSNVSTSTGEFAVGELITAGVSGIPAGTTVAAVGSGSLTLSAAATKNALGVALRGSDLDFNAPASQVESALNALPSVGGEGASVAVSGPNGGPYTITFGGTHGGDNVPALGAAAAGLSGGEKTATISTVTNGGAFEVCVQAAADVCKEGEPGSALGHFQGHLPGIAEDSSGAVYVVDAAGGFQFSNDWVQKFTPSGPGFVPSVFGSDEVQHLAVNAGSGQFRLSFGAERPGESPLKGTTGTGNLVQGSNLITNVVTKNGRFVVGQPISEAQGLVGNNFYIPTNSVITAVSSNTITMSKPAKLSHAELVIYSTNPYTTPDLAFDSPPAAVEAALDALPSVGAAGGSVTVSGGVGDPGATSPYTITFSGGKLHDADVPTIVTEAGATPLSGGSGAGADQATVITTSDGGPRGFDRFSSPVDVAIDDADHVLVAKAFPLGATQCADDGSASPAEVRIVRFDTTGVAQGASAPCLGVPQFQATMAGPNLAVDPINGEPYLSHANVSSQAEPSPIFGTGYFVSVFGDTGSAPSLVLDPPSGVGSSGVTVSGTINPHGPATAAVHPNPTRTKYRVEYRAQGEADWTTYAPDTSIGSGNAAVPFTIGISGLTPNTTYEIRTVVSKLGFPTQFGAPQTIVTAGAPPTIDTFTSSNVAVSSADLQAVINPLGTETSYHFDYGKTPAYGQSTPQTTIGKSQSGVPVSDHVAGLEAAVYHFRVVATNSYGTTTSSDQTFSFYPETCPNSIVRAQTGSGGLPDCRAYELVSPADSGAASLSSGGPNSAYATPSRLSFYGFLGSIPGPWNPQNLIGDLYVATRTPSGWSTHYVGIPADQRPETGGPPNGGIRPEGGAYRQDPILSSLSMDRFLDWDDGAQQIGGGYPQLGSMAPYVWDAEGVGHGRLPTNLADVPNGEADLRKGGFNGDLLPSPDFSHLFFSSANVAFAPGGQTSGNGSVYDNKLATGSVEIVSKLQNGDPIPPEPGDEEDDYFTLPAASTDGSHVLIAATQTAVCGRAKCPHLAGEDVFCYGGLTEGGVVVNVQKCPENLPSHLYMRVGGGTGGITYDVSRGHVVHYDGMTADGSKVFFTSNEDLTSDSSDNDSSADLYMWRESDDSVTRISAGPGAIGNTDNCNSEWVAGCGVEAVPSLEGSEVDSHGERVAVHGGAVPRGSLMAGPTDNSIAAHAGDIYFYSPEQFVPSKGIPGRRNLYVFRGGQIEFVATLDPYKPATRFQVTPDGGRAAFITDSRLTTYDNAGYQEMYTYTPASGQLVCVSCNPSGAPPMSNVEGSQDGIFISDDGRAFFSTETALLSSDTNGLVDVYEYVEGRPRLISSGVASIQQSSFGESGLVGVSADGTDAYFVTFDRLVAGDQNGQLLRIYDARAGGGFPQTTTAAPCAAADECHGPPAQTGPLPAIGSSANLGDGGNLSHAHHKVRKHKRHLKHKKHHKKKGRRR